MDDPSSDSSGSDHGGSVISNASSKSSKKNTKKLQPSYSYSNVKLNNAVMVSSAIPPSQNEVGANGQKKGASLKPDSTTSIATAAMHSSATTPGEVPITYAPNPSPNPTPTPITASATRTPTPPRYTSNNKPASTTPTNLSNTFSSATTTATAKNSSFSSTSSSNSPPSDSSAIPSISLGDFRTGSLPSMSSSIFSVLPEDSGYDSALAAATAMTSDSGQQQQDQPQSDMERSLARKLAIMKRAIYEEKKKRVQEREQFINLKKAFRDMEEQLEMKV